MTKWQLFSLLAKPDVAEVEIAGRRGILLGIDREDGSGSCFNVKLKLTCPVPVGTSPVINIFVRTID